MCFGPSQLESRKASDNSGVVFAEAIVNFYIFDIMRTFVTLQHTRQNDFIAGIEDFFRSVTAGKNA